MGSAFVRASAGARSVFERAGRLLGHDVLRLSLEADRDQLRDTRITQPVVFVCNAAAANLAREVGIRPGVVAGHSVGELNALCVAEAITFETALEAVSVRAELMASRSSPGTMIAVIGLPLEAVEECVDVLDAEVVVVAVVNTASDVVLSGTVAGLDAVVAMLRRRGGARVVPLDVNGAFHSPLMAGAEPEWAAHVAGMPVSAPTCQILLNVTGRLATGPEDIRSALVAQLTRPVQWARVVDGLVELAPDLVVEAGDSRFLAVRTLRRSGLRAVSMSDLSRSVTAMAAEVHRVSVDGRNVT